MQTMISPERAKLNISENLQRLMKAKGVTQLVLAAGAQISQPFVHKMLHGKILPNAVALRNVAEVLGVSTDDLMDDPEKNSEKLSA
jgi:transcriptional regulator with XRE-family HTH domain